MSKIELQKLAAESSGISYDETRRVVDLQPSLFDRLGCDGFYRLSQLFYDKVYSDKENQWFLNIFASSTKMEAIDNQYRFLVQTFGGPQLYAEKKGKYTRLVGRHANYQIGLKAANRWMAHMKAALRMHETLQQDEEALVALLAYFGFTAHYIVFASEYMRPDQLSGGDRLDTGSNW
jgi:truncated hemoglobin YjbI